MLVGDQANGASLSILDCLQLWGAAGWKLEDDEGIPFDLNAIDSLSDIRTDPLAPESAPSGEPSEFFMVKLFRGQLPVGSIHFHEAFGGAV